MPVNGYLLAGGRSSRMGQDKALLRLGGRTLVEIALGKLAAMCRETAIVGNAPELVGFGVPVIQDSIAGCGPLGGIVAGLEHSLVEWNVFLAVDVPFLPAEALRQLLAATEDSRRVAVVAEVGGFPQPLCAVYARRALPLLRRELEAGRWKVMSAIRVAGAVELVPFQDERWFRNLNTPEEFAEAEALGELP